MTANASGRRRREVRRGAQRAKVLKDQACQKNNKKGHIFFFYFSHSSAADIIASAAADIASVSSECDIFAHRPIQTHINQSPQSIRMTWNFLYLPITIPTSI